MTLPTIKREYIMLGSELKITDVIIHNGKSCAVLEMDEPQLVSKWVGDNLVQVEMVNVLLERLNDGHYHTEWAMFELDEEIELDIENDEVYSFCKDHYENFECYPGEVEVSSGKVLEFAEIMLVLTDYQKEQIENQ